MIVVSNDMGTDGAATMLYPEFQDWLESYGDAMIIPSSIHEVIVIPENSVEYEYLAEIIRSVNEEMLSKDEVLSDNVYRIKDHEIQNITQPEWDSVIDEMLEESFPDIEPDLGPEL